MIWDKRTYDQVRGYKYTDTLPLDKLPEMDGQKVRWTLAIQMDLFLRYSVLTRAQDFQIFTKYRIDYNDVRVCIIWEPAFASCWFENIDKAGLFYSQNGMPRPFINLPKLPAKVWGAEPWDEKTPPPKVYDTYHLSTWDDSKAFWVYRKVED